MSEKPCFSISRLLEELSGTGVSFDQTFDVIAVTGSDSSDFLQGQLSQDVAALEVGETSWSMILTPKGHLLAWHRIMRVAEDGFLLVLDPGDGEAALARLSRFKLRVKCELALSEKAFRSIRTTRPVQTPDNAIRFEWNGLHGYDLDRDAAKSDGSVAIGYEDAELVRLYFGVPKSGRELSEGAIPASADLPVLSASFTKGCYVGQELIARMHNRGVKPPTLLHRFDIDAEVSPDQALLDQSGSEVGQLVSVGTDSEARSIGLGYVNRSHSDQISFILAEGGVEVRTRT